MAKFAVITGGYVSNIIEAASAEDAAFLGEVVAYTDENPAHIGLGYDGTTFEQPAKPEPVVEEPAK